MEWIDLLGVPAGVLIGWVLYSLGERSARVRLATRLHESARMIRHLNTIISVQRHDLSLLEQHLSAFKRPNHHKHTED